MRLYTHQIFLGSPVWVLFSNWGILITFILFTSSAVNISHSNFASLEKQISVKKFRIWTFHHYRVTLISVQLPKTSERRPASVGRRDTRPHLRRYTHTHTHTRLLTHSGLLLTGTAPAPAGSRSPTFPERETESATRIYTESQGVSARVCSCVMKKFFV